MMGEIAGKRPRVSSRERVEPVEKNRKTLREYYAEKQERYATEYPDFYDADLRKLFPAGPEYEGNESAAAFLRRARPTIRRMVSQWTGYYEYTLDLVLKEAIGRCRELRLRMAQSPEQTMMDAAIMLTVNCMNFLYSGRRWLDL